MKVESPKTWWKWLAPGPAVWTPFTTCLQSSFDPSNKILTKVFSRERVRERKGENKLVFCKLITWECSVNYIALVTPHYLLSAMTATLWFRHKEWLLRQKDKRKERQNYQKLSLILWCQGSFELLRYSIHPIHIQPQEPASWLQIRRPSIDKLPRVNLQLPRQALGVQPPPAGWHRAQFFSASPHFRSNRSSAKKHSPLLTRPSIQTIKRWWADFQSLCPLDIQLQHNLGIVIFLLKKKHSQHINKNLTIQ